MFKLPGKGSDVTKITITGTDQNYSVEIEIPGSKVAFIVELDDPHMKKAFGSFKAGNPVNGFS
jgi:hypothetical protein